MKNVVLGVSGGIAAYKVVPVVRRLREAGHNVHVVPTRSALEMVGLPTWAAISGNEVTVDTSDEAQSVRHIQMGQEADLIIVAPATANTMAKIAAGIADNLLTTTVLASRAPLLLVPAMHTEMWENPATQANVQVLRSRGVQLVGPAVGRLTGTGSGIGRMVEVETIVEAALSVLEAAPQVTAGMGAHRRLVISGGGTHEPIDPVRYIGNRSSGAMAVALACSAAKIGFDVTLVAANVESTRLAQLPASVKVLKVVTALELSAAMDEQAQLADVVIMAAAVADYRVAQMAQEKMKRGSDSVQLELVPNPDILASLAQNRRREAQLVVGFAAETGTEQQDFLELGRQKARRKGADLLVVNRVGDALGFGDVSTQLIVLDGTGSQRAQYVGTKADVAAQLIELIATQLEVLQAAQ